MKGIILAAGRGSRMGKLTYHTPKCLLKYNYRSLLSYQLDSFHSAGITDIVVITGYLNHLIQGKTFSKIHNHNWSTNQMVASLMCAKDWIAHDDFIVSYSDIFYDCSAVSLLSNSGLDLAVLYDPNWLDLWTLRFEDPLVDAESFLIDEFNVITDIGSRVSDIKKIQGQYMGLTKISYSSWSKIVDYYESLDNSQKSTIDFTTLLKSIINFDLDRLYGVPYEGFWGEIDSANDLQIYNKMVPWSS